MVKVGNSECEFLKWTPLSRTSAIAGAVCGDTMRPRSPSGTNRIRFRGVAFCADAAVAVKVIRLADSNTIVRRIRILPSEVTTAFRRWFGLVLLCDRIVTLRGTGLKGRNRSEIALTGRHDRSRRVSRLIGETLQPDTVFNGRRQP